MKHLRISALSRILLYGLLALLSLVSGFASASMPTTALRAIVTARTGRHFTRPLDESLRQQPIWIGAIDYQASLTSTVYKAFTSVTGSNGRVAADVGTAASNTEPVWVVVLPASVAPPANLAAIESNPASYELSAGQRLVGGAETGASSVIYVAAQSGSQACTILEKATSAALTTIVPSGSGGAGGAVTITSGNVGQYLSGTTLTAVPSNWATGTNWTSGSSPALPSSIKAIWIQVTPGTTCYIEVDGGGSTGFVFEAVQTGWFLIPPGISVTNIYAPANGSTGAVIAGVLS